MAHTLRYLLPFATAVLLALTLPAPSLATGGDPGYDDVAHNPANAARFRAAFGLRDDPDYVERSVSDDDVFSNLTYGVPLTPEEAHDLDARGETIAASGDALHYAQAQSTYAGMYFDQLQRALPTFLFTDKIDEYGAEIRELMPNATFAVRQVDVALGELESTYHAIFDDRDDMVKSYQ